MTKLWDISIAKKYIGKNRVFKIDLHLQSDAQRLVLFGASGAGKTQILKILSGLSIPDKGRIVFDNTVLFDQERSINLPPKQRSLAYVFQEYALFPHLTVLQNIAFPLNQGWFNKGQKFTNEDIEKWIEKFDLKSLVYQYPHQLSGGQSQRVALARALVSKPKALLLDEPFSALDQNLRQTLRQELQDLQAQFSIPMILISHHVEDVENFGDEVIQIDHGNIINKVSQ